MNNSRKKQGPSFSTVLQQKKKNPDHKHHQKGYISSSQIIDDARKTAYLNQFRGKQQKSGYKKRDQKQEQRPNQINWIPYEKKRESWMNPYSKLGPTPNRTPKQIEQNISFSKIKLQSIPQKDVVITSQIRHNEKGQFQINNFVQNQENILITQRPEDAMWILDRIQAEDSTIAPILCDQILNRQQTPLEEQENYQLSQKFDIHIKDKPDSKDKIPLIMLALKKSYQNQGVNIRFSKKSTIKTQISMNHLVTGFLKQLAKCTQQLDDNQKYRVKGIESNQQKYLQFLSWYKKSVKKRMGIEQHNIIIHKINCFRCQVNWSTSQTQKVRQAAIKAPNKIRLHPIFEILSLSPQDFDRKGDFKFPDSKNYIQFRGSWPYYQPVKTKRYGLSVVDKYDYGDNTWLKMQNVKNQWAVAFHGTKSNHLPLILKGLSKGQALKPGKRQAYKNQKALNKQGPSVDVGIYCTPHIQIALQYTDGVQVADKKYHIVFQCRVNPKSVQVCSNHTYWVIGQSKDIRPYGVILVEESIKNEYPKIEQQFGEAFKFDKYKQKIEQALEQYD